MSMWLSYAKVPAEALELLRKKPALVEALFFDSELPLVEGVDRKKDVFGEDWRMIAEVAEAMADGVELEEQETWIAKALGYGMGSPIDYDFCYGPGHFFTVDEVKTIARGLAEEDDPFGVGAFFARAARQGRAIVGGVS